MIYDVTGADADDLPGDCLNGSLRFIPDQIQKELRLRCGHIGKYPQQGKAERKDAKEYEREKTDI